MGESKITVITDLQDIQIHTISWFIHCLYSFRYTGFRKKNPYFCYKTVLRGNFCICNVGKDYKSLSLTQGFWFHNNLLRQGQYYETIYKRKQIEIGKVVTCPKQLVKNCIHSWDHSQLSLSQAICIPEHQVFLQYYS